MRGPSTKPARTAFGGIPLLLVCWLASANASEVDPNQQRVHIVKDVTYLGKDRTEQLDLYLPVEHNNSRRPAIVIIHGGGWQGGDKAASREQNIGNTLAAAGFVCASIDYCLANKSDHLASRLRDVWPRNLHDCKVAVRFLRKHADKYNIDSNHIGAIGGSAGGHLAAMLAVTESVDKLDPDGPYAEYSCRIQAVVPMYGVHDVVKQAGLRGNNTTETERELCRQASPITYITSNDPPTLILHGTKDALVPTVQSQILHTRLQEAKVPSKLLIVKDAPHSFHLQPKQQDLRSTVIEFFERHLK